MSKSANTMSMMTLNKSDIKSRKNRMLPHQVNLIKMQKRQLRKVDDEIEDKKYEILNTYRKMENTYQEIDMLKNKHKMNKTLSLNNDSIGSIANKSKKEIFELMKYIHYLEKELGDFEIAIQLLEQRREKINNNISKFNRELSIIHLSTGGKKKTKRKANNRRTIKKR